MHLSDHSLRQIDEAYVQVLDVEPLAADEHFRQAGLSPLLL
jgi:hypothetical protein